MKSNNIIYIYIYIYIDVVNSISFQTVLGHAFKIVVDSWKFSILFLYILWDDWPIFMISASNEQLQLEYTLLKPDYHCWWISKMQSGREDTLEEQYALKFCFKLGKNATETYRMLQTSFGASCINRALVFEWHKRFKEGRESVRDDERCGRSKKVRTAELIGQRVRVRVTMLRFLRDFRKRFRRKRPALFKSGQWHFHQDNTPVHNSILVTDYLIKMGIKTLPQPPFSPDLAPCDSLWASLSSEAVVMRHLRRWKRLWRRLLIRSHKRTSIGPSRSCCNGTSALQPEEITSKRTSVSCVYYQ